MEIGYWLSSDEHDANELVANAQLAEEAGFEHLIVSDHFHPWVEAQGESPFVWGVIGAIAQATERIRLGTGVTCPLIRLHPAIVAQAAATSQGLMGGRFSLGLGTGENLNEHVLGDRWPRADERLEMLAEAIEIIRKLLGGEYETYRGKHYTVEQARIYSLPDEPPLLIVAAAAPGAAKVAGERGDGYMNVQPDAELIAAYREAGGSGPRYGKVTGALAPSVAEAKRIAKERAGNSALGGSLRRSCRCRATSRPRRRRCGKTTSTERSCSATTRRSGRSRSMHIATPASRTSRCTTSRRSRGLSSSSPSSSRSKQLREEALAAADPEPAELRT